MRSKIPTGWSEDTVENLMSHIIDYRGKTPKKTDYGIPLVTAKIVKNGRVEPYSEFIAEEDYEKWMTRGIPQKGDIVLTVEAPLGEVAQLDGTKIALAQRIVTLRGEDNLISNDYLLYILQSRQLQGRLEARASGTTVIGIKQSELRKVEIPYPPLPIQKKIAHILSTLDDKIELNRKMNQTLEEMAQALFKSWFVDFDPVNTKANCSNDEELEAAAKELGISKEILDLFPSDFEESELGMIPKGWRVEKTNDIVDVFDFVANGSFASLKENVTLYDDPNDILYIRTTDYNHSFKGSLKYTDVSSYKFLKKSKLYGHETIISNVADVGTVFRAPKWFNMPMTLGSNAIGVVGHKGEHLDSYIYYYFKSYLGQHALETITTGSAQLKFNKTGFRALNMLVPSIELRKMFESLENDFYNNIVNLEAQIQTLQKTRDTLLPKLLSGELDVSGLELGIDSIEHKEPKHIFDIYKDKFGEPFDIYGMYWDDMEKQIDLAIQCIEENKIIWDILSKEELELIEEVKQGNIVF